MWLRLLQAIGTVIAGLLLLPGLCFLAVGLGTWRTMPVFMLTGIVLFGASVLLFFIARKR